MRRISVHYFGGKWQVIVSFFFITAVSAGHTCLNICYISAALLWQHVSRTTSFLFLTINDSDCLIANVCDEVMMLLFLE